MVDHDDDDDDDDDFQVHLAICRFRPSSMAIFSGGMMKNRSGQAAVLAMSQRGSGKIIFAPWQIPMKIPRFPRLNFNLWGSGALWLPLPCCLLGWWYLWLVDVSGIYVYIVVSMVALHTSLGDPNQRLEQTPLEVFSW